MATYTAILSWKIDSRRVTHTETMFFSKEEAQDWIEWKKRDVRAHTDQVVLWTFKSKIQKDK